MLQRNNKFMLIMSIVALCCFVFAGAAMAANGKLDVEAIDAKCFGPDYAIANHEAGYVFEATALDIEAACFGNDNNVTININFDGDFDLDATAGLTVPVKVYADNGNWYFAQPTAQINGNEITLEVPAIQELIDTEEVYVNTVVVGDELQNIIATAPCADKTFCFTMTITACNIETKIPTNFRVYDWPEQVEVNAFDTTAYSCDNLCLSGKLYNCAGEGMANAEIYVQYRAVGACDWEYASGCTGDTKTKIGGAFNFCFATPECAGDYEFRILAKGNDITDDGDWNQASDCRFKSEPYAFTVVGSEPETVAWDANADNKDYVECPDVLKYNKCNELTLNLLDYCECNTNEAEDFMGNLATNDKDRVIKLDAFFGTQGAPVVAGHFYATAEDCANDANQIGTITIPAGQSSIKVYFKPIMPGYEGQTEDFPITLKASAAGLTGHLCTPAVTVNNKVNLEVKPLATNSAGTKARAGWPLEAAAWIDSSTFDNMGAAGNYKVCVRAFEGESELTDFMVSTELIPAYSPDADCVPCELDECKDCPRECRCFSATYCTVKNHFYIYAPADWAGKTVRFEVSFMNERGNLITSEENVIVDFITPIELKRTLDFDTWQLISTPKYLAKECVVANGDPNAYGTFEDLLDANDVNYSKIITWDENGWRVVASDEVVEPLKAYFVKTTQRDVFDSENYLANYVFARVTHPSLMMPKVRDLGAGWNLVGVAVADTDNDGQPLFRQSDDIYVAMGAAYKGAKLVWNPGNYLGNLAGFISSSWVTPNGEETDEYVDVFNGDGYWSYLNDWQSLVANIGQDLIDDGEDN